MPARSCLGGRLPQSCVRARGRSFDSPANRRLLRAIELAAAEIALTAEETAFLLG